MDGQTAVCPAVLHAIAQQSCDRCACLRISGYSKLKALKRSTWGGRGACSVDLLCWDQGWALHGAHGAGSGWVPHKVVHEVLPVVWLLERLKEAVLDLGRSQSSLNSRMLSSHTSELLEMTCALRAQCRPFPPCACRVRLWKLLMVSHGKAEASAP